MNISTGQNELGFDGNAVFDESWWPKGRARVGVFLVVCLMAVAMILLAGAPAFAATSYAADSAAALASSVAVTSSNNPAKAGQAVTFTATVTPAAATGTVQFKIDGVNAGAAVPVSGGTAGLAMSSAPPVGPHTVVAEYSGDATVAPSTGTLAGGQQVTKGDSTTTVTSSRNPAKLHEPVSFTVNVLPSTAGGSVQLKMNGINFGAPLTLNNGTAGFAVTTLSGPPGTRTLVAEYSGDANFNPSTGTLAGGQQVTKGDSTTTVTSSKNPSRPGEDITITASVFPRPGATGTVRFKVDGEVIDEPVALSDGVAEIELTSDDDSTGTSAITAEYSGDVNFNPSTGTLPGGQVVSGKQATTTKLSLLANSNKPEERTFVATVSPANASGTVQFKVDGTSFGSPVALSNGVAKSGPTTLSAGNHAVVAEYSGDANFRPSSDTASVPGVQTGPKIATSVKLTYGINSEQMSKAVTFHAAITPAEATGTVQFKLDGKNIGSPVAVKDGVANSAPVTLKPGNHRVEAEYSGDARYQPSRGVMERVNVGSGKTGVLPRTGSSTVPLALLAASFLVSGVLIQRRANRVDAAKMQPEDYL
ncbi:MAG TPA: Ig-like domain-containing protein [Actinomycetota bacterium]|nr:Ig-like domain-containing protein [Actinomycetota bacterium]